MRYHQELSRVRKVRFTWVTLLEIVPRLVLSVVVLYPLSWSLFVDFDRIKQHKIAKLELQKFDPAWFTYDDQYYQIANAPVYQHEDSVWGRLYPSRLFTSYYQTAGWIKRRREANPSIMNELPPKYEFTPKGPREDTDFKAIENKRPKFLINSNNV